jgi:hypothetical protein
MDAASFEWIPFNIIEEGDVLLRRGDALRLTAVPAGESTGNVSISINGVTNYITQASVPVVHRFDTPGDFAITAIWDDGAQSCANTVMLTVVSAELPETDIAAWQGRERQVQLPFVPSGNVAVVVSDDTLIGPLAPHGAGTALPLTAGRGDEQKFLAIALSVDGQEGPILDSRTINSFWECHTVEGWFHEIETLPDGTRVVQNRLIVGFLPQDVELRLSVFVSGASFENGSSVLAITAADLTPEGEYVYRMLMAPGVSAPCHYVRAYQGDAFIGQR